MADAGDVHYLLQLPEDLDTPDLKIDTIYGEGQDAGPPPPKGD